MNRPANVIYIVSALVTGGVQHAILTLLSHLDRAKYRGQVCCTYKRGELAPLFEEAGIPVHLVPMHSRFNPLDLWRMSRFLQREQADIVHTHMYASNVSGAAAARLAGISNVVSHLHSSHELTSANRIRTMRWTDGWRKAYFAVSGHVREDFLQLTHVQPEKVHVCYNAIDPPAPQDEQEGARLRAELGIAAGAPVIRNVGRLVPVKGTDVFVRAAAVVARQRPDARFVVVGSGKELGNLKKLAAELGVSGQVFFVGQQQNTQRFYQMFDLFALTSRTEGFGNVLLEAYHAHLPVVATRVGGIPEVVLDGKTGLLAPSESHEEIGRAILTLLQDGQKSEEFARAGLEYAKQFSVEAAVDKLEALYDSLLP
jgi:L-malate glycosyltransferase